MEKSAYKSIEPNQVNTGIFHKFLLGSVVPRPIALAGTVDEKGNHNLSPFSFFNVFGANPPVMIFSPSRRVRDNTNKHTLENILEVPEVMIHIVDYGMVEQMSLSSTEYQKGVNEYIKAGFETVVGTRIKPLRIIGAPVAFECNVLTVIETGDEGGAGNLIISEVVCMHVREDLLDENGMIDPLKMDVVCRLGGDWYGRINAQNMFEIPKPISTKGIGFDQLPDYIMSSRLFTGNQLARLANVNALPAKDYVEEVSKSYGFLAVEKQDKKEMEKMILDIVYRCIDQNEPLEALALLQLANQMGCWHQE
jgi:flavin reductase (DIM6/NTAB) family NADH-FMN oxidoreductase RutF